MVSQSGLTRVPGVAAACAAGTRIRKPRPTPIRPNENLTGLAGSRDPSAIHNQANTGANMMMKSAFADWNQLLGKFAPRNDVRVERSAKIFNVDPACSNSDQKSAAQRKKTPMTYRRLRSAGVQSPAKNNQLKKTTVVMRRSVPAALAI